MTTRWKLSRKLRNMARYLDPERLQGEKNIGKQEGDRSHENQKVQEECHDQRRFRVHSPEPFEKEQQDHEAGEEDAPHQHAD